MYKSLDKNSIKVMRINAIISGLIIFLISFIGLIIILFSKTPNYINIISIIVFIIIIILIILNITLFTNLRYKRCKYLVNSDNIEVITGLFLITHSIIQIKRVQKIELNNGPIDRRYNLSNVEIYTAAGLVKIKFLNEKEAKDVTNKVNKLLKQKLEQSL